MHCSHPRLENDRDIFVFDLDNTLYPADCALFPQVEKRIGQFVESALELGPTEARAYQKKLFMDHGTTLNGLMIHHGTKPEDFLSFVHDIDFTPIGKDIALRSALEALGGRRVIYTNADQPYTEQVLNRLGISDLFEGIYDIVAATMRPKPEIDAYRDMLKQFDIDPTRAIMFEDMARNLVPAHRLGMGCVWINTGSVWGEAGHDDDCIHAETPALTPWLSAFATDRTPA